MGSQLPKGTWGHSCASRTHELELGRYLWLACITVHLGCMLCSLEKSVWLFWGISVSSPGPHWDMSGVLFRDQLESFSATPPLFLMPNFLPNIFNLVKPVVSSVAQPCLTLCNPMDCSTPDIPVHHQLPEFTQTHVHWVSDAIQPSHPLSSPSSPDFSLS